MNVVLHIDRLVLDGLDVPFASRAVLRGAIERELTALIAAGGVSPALRGGTALPSIGVPQIEVSNAPKPAKLGQAIAGSLYAGVGGAAVGRK